MTGVARGSDSIGYLCEVLSTPPPPVMVSESEVPMGPDFGEIEMYANANVMRMPTNYVDMNADEIEYDGGWSWLKTIAKGLVTAAVVVGTAAATAVASPAAGIAVGAGLAFVGSMANDWIDEQDW